MPRRKLLKFDVPQLIEDLGGAAEVAEITDSHRTAPYRWMRSRYMSTRVLERIMTVYPDLDLNGYFRSDLGV